jgi:hypothetical protein
MRRLVNFASIATQGMSCMIVSHDEEDIGARIRRQGQRGREENQGERREKASF